MMLEAVVIYSAVTLYGLGILWGLWKAASGLPRIFADYKWRHPEATKARANAVSERVILFSLLFSSIFYLLVAFIQALFWPIILGWDYLERRRSP